MGQSWGWDEIASWRGSLGRGGHQWAVTAASSPLHSSTAGAGPWLSPCPPAPTSNYLLVPGLSSPNSLHADGLRHKFNAGLPPVQTFQHPPTLPLKIHSATPPSPPLHPEPSGIFPASLPVRNHPHHNLHQALNLPLTVCSHLCSGYPEGGTSSCLPDALPS